MKELEKDMAMLRNGMKEVEREVEFFRTQPTSNGDRYLPVMKEFLSKASVRLAELEDLFTDMKARVSEDKAKRIRGKHNRSGSL
jgi:dishevelled associated activator of morphogenesis